MKLTKNILRQLIKEQINEIAAPAGAGVIFVKNKGQLPADNYERQRHNWEEEDFEMARTALKATVGPQANLIQVMFDEDSEEAQELKRIDPEAYPTTPEFKEKVQNNQATDDDYMEFGKDDEGRLYVKLINGPVYGYITAAGNETPAYAPKRGLYGDHSIQDT